MAYLLGAAAVMESLQKDVRDVQSCALDIISRYKSPILMLMYHIQ